MLAPLGQQPDPWLLSRLWFRGSTLPLWCCRPHHVRLPACGSASGAGAQPLPPGVQFGPLPTLAAPSHCAVAWLMSSHQFPREDSDDKVGLCLTCVHLKGLSLGCVRYQPPYSCWLLSPVSQGASLGVGQSCLPPRPWRSSASQARPAANCRSQGHRAPDFDPRPDGNTGGGSRVSRCDYIRSGCTLRQEANA